MLNTLREHGKTEILVGIEPTGHYWLNLAYFLEDRGIPLVMTNPMHVSVLRSWMTTCQRNMTGKMHWLLHVLLRRTFQLSTDFERHRGRTACWLHL